jgi:hypothetical protein
MDGQEDFNRCCAGKHTCLKIHRVLKIKRIYICMYEETREHGNGPNHMEEGEKDVLETVRQWTNWKLDI